MRAHEHPQGAGHGHHDDHGGDHGHHGHRHDRGVAGFLRYVRLLPKMWRSEVNREVVREIAPARGESVVDLGAGMGAATVEAARRGARVIAVDPTPFMRRILDVRRGWQRHRGAIGVVDGAAESMPLLDRSVDALWTVNTVHHWTDRVEASRELARVMKAGGRVLLVDEDFDDPSHPEHARWRAGRERHGPRFDSVDAEAVAASLARAGFAHARGCGEAIAGRPAKVIRATR